MPKLWLKRGQAEMLQDLGLVQIERTCTRLQNRSVDVTRVRPVDAARYLPLWVYEASLQRLQDIGSLAAFKGWFLLREWSEKTGRAPSSLKYTALQLNRWQALETREERRGKYTFYRLTPIGRVCARVLHDETALTVQD